MITGGRIMFTPALFNDNFFDDFFGTREAEPRHFEKPALRLMSTDVRETENGYELSVDLPGYELENIKGEVKDGYLTITAEHKNETEERDKKTGYIRKERYTGSCSRTFYVGEGVTQEDIKAKYRNGVLTIDVPKKDVNKVPEKRFIQIDG